MCAKVLKITCKRFIKPQVAPPETRDKITKPLVGQLVSYYSGHEYLIQNIGMIFIIEQVRFSENTKHNITSLINNDNLCAILD